VTSRWLNVRHGIAAALACAALGLSAAGPLPISGPIAPQTVMCMSSGEQTSGMNKICYYDCLGSTQTITQSATSLCRLSISGALPGSRRPPPPNQAPRGGQTVCFARGEQISGMNKICYYDCLGSAYAVTQSSVSLCALTVTQ
jgi:hypothetical protein